MLPETHTSLPAFAPFLRSAAPIGTSPMMVIVSDSGPRVVSPPMSETLNSSARSKNPFANAASQPWSTVGTVRASIAQYGIAPIAAMSERFTASALWPRFSGGTSGKKCVPDTMVSVETARSMPLVMSTRAQSSPTPSTALAAGRVKWRAMRSNSGLLSVIALLSLSRLLRGLAGAQLPCQLVEDAVYVLVAVRPAEALAELDGLVDRDAERNILLVRDLPRADQQYRALDRAHFLPRPVGQRLQALAQLRHAGDRALELRGEEFPVGLLEPVEVREILDDLRSRAAGMQPLVHALDGQLAGAPPRRPHPPIALRVFAISTAARAASAPFTGARLLACSSLSHVSTPLATGMPVSSCTSRMPRALSLATTSRPKADMLGMRLGRARTRILPTPRSRRIWAPIPCMRGSHLREVLRRRRAGSSRRSRISEAGSCRRNSTITPSL